MEGRFIHLLKKLTPLYGRPALARSNVGWRYRSAKCARRISRTRGTTAQVNTAYTPIGVKGSGQSGRIVEIHGSYYVFRILNFFRVVLGLQVVHDSAHAPHRHYFREGRTDRKRNEYGVFDTLPSECGPLHGLIGFLGYHRSDGLFRVLAYLSLLRRLNPHSPRSCIRATSSGSSCRRGGIRGRSRRRHAG